MARACNSSIREAKVGGSEILKPAWTIYIRSSNTLSQKNNFKNCTENHRQCSKLRRQTRLSQILGFPWKHYNNIKYVCIIREKKDKAESARACCLSADETWFCTMWEARRKDCLLGRVHPLDGNRLCVSSLLGLLQSRPLTPTPRVAPRDSEPVRSEFFFF